MPLHVLATLALLAQEPAPAAQGDPPHDDDFASIVEHHSQADLMRWVERHPWGLGTEVRKFLLRFEEVRGQDDPAENDVWEVRAAFLAEFLAGEPSTPWILSVMRWDVEQRARFDTVRAGLDSLPAAIETGGAASIRAEVDSLRPPTAPNGAWELCAPELTRVAGAAGSAGARDEARSLAEEIAASADRERDGEIAAWCANFLGQTARKEGRLRAAAGQFAKAVEIARGLGDEATALERLCDLSSVRLALGDLEGALSGATEAEALSRARPNSGILRRFLLVEATSLVGLGEFEHAFRILASAEAAGGAGLPQDETQVRLLLLHGDALSEVGRVEAARAYLDRALVSSGSEKLRSEAPLLRGEVLLSAGRLRGELGAPDSALAAFDEAVDILDKAGDLRGVAWAQKDRGFALSRAGRRVEADAAFEQGLSFGLEEKLPLLTGLCALGRAEDSAGNSTLPADFVGWLATAETCAAELNQGELLSRVEALRGEIAARKGEPKEALEHLGRSVGALEGLRRRVSVPGLLARYLRDRPDPYRDAALAAARAGATDEAWRYAEMLHARALLELRATPSGPLTSLSVDSKVGGARRALAQRESLLRHAEAEDRAALLDPVRAAEKDLDAALSEAEARAPRWMRLLGTGRGSFDPARAQERLAASGLDALVEYVVAEPETLALTITVRGRTAKVLPIGAGRIQALLQRLRDPIERLRRGEVGLANLGFDASAARELHAALVQPLAGRLGRRIGIVPDGGLWSLPFEMLVAGGEERPVDPARPFAHLLGLHFLVEDRAVVYLPSAALLGSLPHGNGVAGALVFRAPSQPGLQPAGEEAPEFSGSNFFAPVRVLAGATAADVRKETEAAAFLHFAAHGLPERLEAWEIEGFALRARLVVLSACDRGGPGHATGAEVLGLTRSFLAAGADEVIANLWEVEDCATADWMRIFYGHLARGESVIDALRAARLEVMKSDDPRGFSRTHPWFWAAWVDHRGI
jgi:CHAT domain-containing protein